jgi:maleate isomerase
MSDIFGFRMKFGIVTPSTNTVLQPQMEALRPPGVTNQISRMHISNADLHTASDFKRMLSEVNTALEAAVDCIMTCEPGHLILGISGESVWGGGLSAVEAIRKRIASRAGGIGITMPADALSAALRVYGVRQRVAIITPYHQSAHDNVVGLFRDIGYEVGRAKHLQRQKPTDIAATPEAELRHAVLDLESSDIEAIVQLGANLPMWRVAVEAERWLSKPVLSVNTVTYWHALRSCGIKDRIPSEGRLLWDW